MGGWYPRCAGGGLYPTRVATSRWGYLRGKCPACRGWGFLHGSGTRRNHAPAGYRNVAA